ncbi:HPP family-domain-containing protein [Xylaria bambusicola]|uniref:HPP family-domain-containing protein n=1 Tax=Xylaria bambusicola TaxID=326684 RepID=UPI0020074575|nr:HPP family-domain-containing protein [Xylaria bambusicola]KAI0526427.1 HPP family-domain-containing protein [Xylaria bambusicola]
MAVVVPFWQLNFDIDKYVNRLIPDPPWHAVPYPIAYILGYRKSLPETPLGNLLLAARALLGVFISILLIQVISHQIPWVAADGPRIIGSFGAAAVLEFYAFESPFAQPRNFIASQVIATVVGVSLCKLFQLHSNEEWIRWLGGSLACAATTSLMGLTKTIHPPAGATALLAVVDDRAVQIGWKLIPLALLSCSIMLIVALVLNNIFSRFPLYWWTAANLRSIPQEQLSGLSVDDEEKGKSQRFEIIIGDKIIVPEHIQLSAEERLLLEKLSSRL